MNLTFFISRRLPFKGTIAVTSIAISYLVMIIAVSVSSGFRNEIRDGLSEISGDIQITPPNLNVLDQSRPIEKEAAYLPYLQNIVGVDSLRPVVYMAGIIKQEDNIHGVLFKGMDRAEKGVCIPQRLAEIAGLSKGDSMTAYFVGEKVRVRKFEITSVYESLVEADDRLIVYADLADLQRLSGWSEDKVSSIEILLESSYRDETSIQEYTQEVGAVVNAYSEDSEAPVIAVSSVSRFSQLFEWLDLIDFNVTFILILMTIVAGFNMISGLLIMLFENISTIGLFKAIGMSDKAISKVFLSKAASLVLKGMVIGNVLAFAFCLVQSGLHVFKLDPKNYFVSYVPVNIDAGSVLLADILSFVVIMILLLIPVLFVSKVDPADTVRMK